MSESQVITLNAFFIAAADVGHADELIYLFAGGTLLDPVFPKGLTDPDDVHLRNMMVKMWVNFATSG